VSLGLFASLDNATALAKVAVASLDDAAVQSARADIKAVGISLMVRR
jgi:predicted DNA repair protein MutK